MPWANPWLSIIRQPVVAALALLLLPVCKILAADQLSDPTTQRAALDQLVAAYANPPLLHVRFHYALIAGKDYVRYHHDIESLLGTQHPGIAQPPRGLGVLPGDIIARCEGEYWGSSGDYAVTLKGSTRPGGTSFPRRDSSVLFDGKQYLVKMGDDPYTAIDPDYQPTISSYSDALASLPPYIPDGLRPLETDGAMRYSRLLTELRENAPASVTANNQELTLKGLVRRRPGDTPAESRADWVEVILTRFGTGYAITNVNFQTVEFQDDKETRRFPASSITFSDFTQVAGFLFPKTVLLTLNSSLVDAGGNDLDVNAQITGETVNDLKTKVFSVVTHKYTCDLIEALPEKTPPSMRFKQGDIIYNRSNGNSIRLPQNMSITNISKFLDPITGYPHRFNSASP